MIDAPTLLANLETANGKVWQMFGKRDTIPTDTVQRNRIQNQLNYFASSHTNDVDHINDVVEVISRGYALIKAGIQWQNPVVGSASEEPTKTDLARGIQWQLVITYAGFELLVKILMNEQSRGGLTLNTIQNFVQKCNLPTSPDVLNPPSNLSNLDEWLTKPATSTGDLPILGFLGVENGDKTIISDWLIQSRPANTWVDVVRLAKAIRNTSAHGALSATKLGQWGLIKQIPLLTNNLGEIAVAALDKLG